MIFTGSTPDSVFNDAFMSGLRRAKAIIKSAIKEFEDYELDSQASIGSARQVVATDGDADNLEIFLVHGHDNEMKETVARFVERLGINPIILHEQANAGDTIIEKFERHADASYAIVLLSPDDVGAAKNTENDLKARARQNVVLELGYFIGRLGRSKVCPLVRGIIELPSDIHGVVYVPFEGESWKMHLVKEFKYLGFVVDANKAF